MMNVLLKLTLMALQLSRYMYTYLIAQTSYLTVGKKTKSMNLIMLTNEWYLSKNDMSRCTCRMLYLALMMVR